MRNLRSENLYSFIILLSSLMFVVISRPVLVSLALCFVSYSLARRSSKAHLYCQMSFEMFLFEAYFFPAFVLLITLYCLACYRTEKWHFCLKLVTHPHVTVIKIY